MKNSEESNSPYNELGVQEKYVNMTIEFKGESWNYIKTRIFTNSKVYRSIDCSKYLRIGDVKNIRKETSYIKMLLKLGFPIPDLLEDGEINDYGYYIERSIGIKSFRDEFCEEYSLKAHVSQDTLESFCNIICTFFCAQIKSSSHFTQRSDLKKNIMLKNVLNENPDLNVADIEASILKIYGRLLSLPKTFTHGDLTPRNTFKAGIIDLEFGSIAPIGYDVLTAPIMERFWGFKNLDNETYEDFYLNDEQISYYLNRIEKVAKQNGIEDFLKFTDDFILLKAIWSLAHEKYLAVETADMSKWNFRKKILIYCMQRYLNDKPIETKKFRMLYN